MDLSPPELFGQAFGGFPLLGGKCLGGRSGLRSGSEVQFLHQSSKKGRRIHAQVMRFIEVAQCSRRIGRQNMLEQAPDASTVGEAEHVAHLLCRDCPAPVGDRLVEDREPVASRTFRCARDHAQRIFLDLDALFLGNIGKMRRQLLGRDTSQVETLRP